MKGSLVAAAVVSAVMVLGCSGSQLGFPRVPVRAVSPDGRHVAFVRNHPSVDPPDQTLWLGDANGDAKEVARLAPDAMWSDRIVWSADSRRVAFVVADAIVHLYDAGSKTSVFVGFVGRRSWDTPPRYVLRDVTLSADGASISFIECERTFRPVEQARQNPRGTRMTAVISGCSPARQTTVFSQVRQTAE